MPFNDFSQPSSTHLLFDAYFFPEDELLHAETFLDILGEKKRLQFIWSSDLIHHE
jgi:hypothetical protein